MSDEILNKMVQIQQFKDRRMAEKSYLKSKHQAVLIAGRNPVDKDFGVPLHIDDYRSGKSVVVIGMSFKNDPLKKIDKLIMWLISGDIRF